MSRLTLYHPDLPREFEQQMAHHVTDWLEKRGYSNVVVLTLYWPVRPFHVSNKPMPETATMPRVEQLRIRRVQCVRVDGVAQDPFWLIEADSPTDLAILKEWSAEVREARYDM